MTKIRKLMVLGVMALMIMAVALPSALAQGSDPCWYGCNPLYWSAPPQTDPPTEENLDEDRFVVVAWDSEDDCWLIWDRKTDELFSVCED